MAYVVTEAMQDIESFKARHMRSINQEKSRIEILNELSNEKMLIHQDWAIKFLPSKYRELRKQRFAKRVLSW